MSGNFITNQEELLEEVFQDVLPSTDKLFFLVGYFYFSGFEQIYNNLGDKTIKILVGMDIERGILNKIKEFEVIQEINLSRENAKRNFYKSLVELFNDTDFFDSKEKQQAFKLFLNMMKNNTLELRKTSQPCHAKLYLFEKKPECCEGGRYPGVMITGSSNFSISGLRERLEINVIFRDDTFNKGKKFFEELWDKSVPIVGPDNLTEFMNNVVEKVWMDKLPKPFTIYLRVLDEYFSIVESEIKSKTSLEPVLK